LVPERSEGRDAPWCGTRQRSYNSAHSRTCGDCVCEGARVESAESKVERAADRTQRVTPVKVGCTRTSTTDEPPRRAVGRHSVIMTFLLKPTTKGPTQPPNSRLHHRTPELQRTPPLNLRPSFLCNQPTNRPTLSFYSEDGVVIYRSPWAGRGLGEADVTVCPDWTGPSWGPPFLGGNSARQGKPAHSTCV